jgi:hypothetical protein
MATLAELRARARRGDEALEAVHVAHRKALNCLAYDDESCLCDCGCPRARHAIGRDRISQFGYLLQNHECSECSCVHYQSAESYRCDYCGNTVRVGFDDDHCNDCSLVEVET